MVNTWISHKLLFNITKWAIKRKRKLIIQIPGVPLSGETLTKEYVCEATLISHRSWSTNTQPYISWNKIVVQVDVWTVKRAFKFSVYHNVVNLFGCWSIKRQLSSGWWMPGWLNLMPQITTMRRGEIVQPHVIMVSMITLRKLGQKYLLARPLH